MNVMRRLGKRSRTDRNLRDSPPLIFTTTSDKKLVSISSFKHRSVLTRYEDFMPKRDDKAWNLSVFKLVGLCTVWVSLLSISNLPRHQPSS